MNAPARFLCDSPTALDPTGTHALRAYWRKYVSARLETLRRNLRMAVIDNDILHLGEVVSLSTPAGALKGFELWFTDQANNILGNAWLDGFVKTAWVEAHAVATVEVKSVLAPTVVSEADQITVAAASELKGIIAVAIQQIVRAASDAIVSHAKPRAAYSAMVQNLDHSTIHRLRALVNVAAVAAHNRSKIATYRRAGIAAVGIRPERKKLKRGKNAVRQNNDSHGHHHYNLVISDDSDDDQLVGVLTAGDDDVCQDCQDIADDAPYTLDEADALLPAHPNCRCAVYPYDDRRYAGDSMHNRDFDESEERDESGRWTNGGNFRAGSEPHPDGGHRAVVLSSIGRRLFQSTGSYPTPETARIYAMSVVTKQYPGETFGKAPASAVAPDVVELPNKRVEEFTKAKINLALGKPEIDKFVSNWDDRVKVAPDQFKKAFLGNVNADMNINTRSGDQWEFSGPIHSADGTRIGSYKRRIDWANKIAHSDFFQLNGSNTGSNVGKQLLAGNVAMYKQLGLKSVAVHANIDVGGYAWAKYGYVPDQSSWNGLRHDILGKLDSGSGSAYSGETYRPGSWVEIPEDAQMSIYHEWANANQEEFEQSAVERWREDNQDIDQAREDLVHSTGWVKDVVKDHLADADNQAVPYTADQLSAAISVEYTSSHNGSGDGDFEVKFDDSKLLEPSDAPPKEQMLLPGFKKIDLSAHLTESMRASLTEAITNHFDDQAEKNRHDVEPPSYLTNDIGNEMDDYWGIMSDRDRYRWADRNGHVPEVPVESDEPALDLDDSANSALRKLAESRDPKAIWAIADSPQGKDLLLGTDWYGKLDLEDPETMARFDAYVGKAAK